MNVTPMPPYRSNVRVTQGVDANVHSYAKPCEDVVRVEERNGIFILCDGGTRELVNGRYPVPSIAERGAIIVADELLNSIRKALAASTAPIRALKDGVIAASAALQRFQKQAVPIPDYFVNDFPEVALGALIVVDRTVYWASIADVSLFVRDGGTRVTKILNKPTIEAVYACRDILYPHSTGDLQSRSQALRKDHRNSPSSTTGYGILTGEPSALEFVEYGSAALKPSDQFLLCSDGVTPTVPFTFEWTAEALIRDAKEGAASGKWREDDRSVILLHA